MSSRSPSSISVLLLKAPVETEEEDAYIKSCKEASVEAKLIPTLQFKFKNIDLLLKCLNDPDRYAGIIFNSPRCVRSVIESTKCMPLNEQWRKLKCFVVGEATGKLVKQELNLNCEGQSSGNLSNLFQEISKYDLEKPLLFPVGNLHKDIKTNVKLEKIEVYETHEHEQLKELFEAALKENVTNVIVFFSPSAVASTLPYIPSNSDKKFQFLAIGPTTAEDMKNKNLKVDGVCEKPNPGSLMKLLLNLQNQK